MSHAGKSREQQQGMGMKDFGGRHGELDMQPH
jgi:hypothetical protein